MKIEKFLPVNCSETVVSLNVFDIQAIKEILTELEDLLGWQVCIVGYGKTLRHTGFFP